MGKINDTTDYASVTPADGDHVIGTDVSDTVIHEDGETVTFTMQQIADYVRTRGIPYSYILARSGVSSSHTGDTNETVLATVTVPAGALGPNGFVRVRYHIAMNNDASNKTFRMILDSEGLGVDRQIWVSTTASPTSSSVNVREAVFMNRGSESSQSHRGSTAGGEPGNSSVATGTMSIDTSLSWDLEFNCTLSDAADTLALRYYIVEIGYAA